MSANDTKLQAATSNQSLTIAINNHIQKSRQSTNTMGKQSNTSSETSGSVRADNIHAIIKIKDTKHSKMITSNQK